MAVRGLGRRASWNEGTRTTDMIKRTRDRAAGGHRLTFVLPSNEPAGRVSVVGSFNDWTPGTHELRRRSNGTRSVSVPVRDGQTVLFRYLGEDGMWFDDPEADAITEVGGRIEVTPA
jgi:1,4-alpha-glucan branching enzyme